MAEGLRRKHIILGLLLALLLALPPLALSGFGTGRMQGWVDAHRDRPFARSLQLKVAWIYRYTLRTQKASDAYEKYLQYFSPEAQPNNQNPDEYFSTAYEWCCIGEDLEISQQWMAYRWYDFLYSTDKGMGYAYTRPDTPEVERAQRRYDTLWR